jgi:hypothetical protein
MKRLPLDSLNRKVNVHAPRTEAEITQLIENKATAEVESDGTLPEATTQAPSAEVTAEATSEPIPSAEVTPEVIPSEEATSEVAPTETGSAEPTPNATATETGESDDEAESTPEASSEAPGEQSSGGPESTPDVQSGESSISGDDDGSESTPEAQPSQTAQSGDDQQETAYTEDSLLEGEATPEPEPVEE